jgi:hypothetical protein
MRYPREDLPHRHPRRSMIGAYGDTACSPRYEAQAGKPQLGASHSTRSRFRYRIRTAGQATATHGKDVYLVSGAAHLVRAKQEPVLYPRMVTYGVGHHRGSKLQRRRVTTQALECSRWHPNKMGVAIFRQHPPAPSPFLPPSLAQSASSPKTQ